MEEYIVQYFHSPSRKQKEHSSYITWAGHRKCNHNHVVGPRVLENYKMVFVVNGKGYLTQGKCTNKLISTGDMFVLFPREKHYYFADQDDPWEIIWVSFNGDQFAYLLDILGLDLQHCNIHNVITHDITNKLLLLINELANDDDAQFLCLGYFLQLLHHISQIVSSNGNKVKTLEIQDMVQKALLFIEQNYYMNLNVDMLCTHVSYSRSYLSRQFKKETGMSIPEYVSKIRIQNALVLLQETNLSIQEVAASVGVLDPFYFSKIFKKITGLSPNAYKEKLRN